MLKVIIEKQKDKLGDEYMEQEEVTADITLSDNNIVMEVDDALYVIPLAIIKGLEIVSSSK